MPLVVEERSRIDDAAGAEKAPTFSPFSTSTVPFVRAHITASDDVAAVIFAAPLAIIPTSCLFHDPIGLNTIPAFADAAASFDSHFSIELLDVK